jgi:hypothetical protein
MYLLLGLLLTWSAGHLWEIAMGWPSKKNNEKQSIPAVSRQTIVRKIRRDTMSSWPLLLQELIVATGLTYIGWQGIRVGWWQPFLKLGSQSTADGT